MELFLAHLHSFDRHSNGKYQTMPASLLNLEYNSPYTPLLNLGFAVCSRLAAVHCFRRSSLGRNHQGMFSMPPNDACSRIDAKGSPIIA